jgi:polysaccharide biosynthesis protein PslG
MFAEGLRPLLRWRWLWLGVLIILVTLIVLVSTRHFGATVPLGPQQHVRTINPKMGMHTRLTDEAEPWKIKRTLEMVREMGAPWIVEYFPWAYYEPQPGRYNWNHPDLVIDHANRQGLTVIARLGYVPDWARPQESTPLLLEEDRYDDFGRFAAEFVRRYADRVDYVIIWNEPNLSLEWGYRPVDPESYVEMLRVVYPMVKEANPQVQVLGGALAPTLAPPNSEWGMNDLIYLQRMYDAGAADYFDILAVHSYGWYSDADEPPDPEVINFRRTELVYEIMQRNGDGDKPVMITEGGWNDHPRWTRAVRPARRIQNTIRAYEIAQHEWPWLESLSFWAFRYPWDAKTYQDYFTFVDTQFEPKPIYLEVQSYSRGQWRGE